MSIIHEALKKAQKNLKDAPQKNFPRPIPAATPMPEPKLAPKPEPSPDQYTAPAMRSSVEIKIPTPVTQTKIEPAGHQPFYKLLPIKKLILAGILLVLLIAARPFLTAHPPQPLSAAPAAVTAPSSSALPAAPAAKGGYFADVPAAAIAPTTPPANPAPTTNSVPVLRPQLILNGVSITGAKPMALINNEIYEVGETVYGLMILSITESGVELMDGDQKIFLKKRR